MQDALEQQRAACLACDRESAARQSAVSEHQMALDAAQRAKAGLREQLQLAERRLVHQAGEVAALREANEKLELAVAGLKVCTWMQSAHTCACSGATLTPVHALLLGPAHCLS